MIEQHHLRIRTLLEENGSIGSKQISDWIQIAYSRAKRWILYTYPVPDTGIPCSFELKPSSELPLGRWMGCYPELRDGKARLTVLQDWSFFLYVLYLSVKDYVQDDDLLQEAFLDRSRLKIGIMNDVYQPFAPLPDPYSMIRHHSFILYLSLRWLSPSEQQRWTLICRKVGHGVAKMMASMEHPLDYADRIETSASRYMQTTAAASCSAKGSEEIVNDALAMDGLTRYFALTCFGIDVVRREHEKNGFHDHWLKEEIELRLSQPDYLNQAILEYVEQIGGGKEI